MRQLRQVIDYCGWLRPLAIARVAVLGVALSTSCIHVKPAKLVNNDPEFKARVGSLAAAYQALDINAIMAFYAQDTYSLSFDLPYKFDTGAGPHRQRLETFLARIAAVRVTTGDNIEVWRDDNRVWTIRSFAANGTFKTGEKFHFDGTFSAVWEPRGKQWSIVYEHFWGPIQVASAQPAIPPLPPAATPEPVTPPVPPPPPEPSLQDSLKDVFFDYDKWNIRPNQVGTLTANAILMRKYPHAVITIEGHCDERGTRPYNRTLGQHRADETKKYLVSLGIPPDRLLTVSKGKEQPFELGRGEPAWGKNRRSHFVVTRQ
jgi:peptidoglycan-associated lipoprotein